MIRLTVFLDTEDASRVTTWLTKLYDVRSFGAGVRALISEKLKETHKRPLQKVEIGKGRLKKTV